MCVGDRGREGSAHSAPAEAIQQRTGHSQGDLTSQRPAQYCLPMLLSVATMVGAHSLEMYIIFFPNARVRSLELPIIFLTLSFSESSFFIQLSKHPILRRVATSACPWPSLCQLRSILVTDDGHVLAGINFIEHTRARVRVFARERPEVKARIHAFP